MQNGLHEFIPKQHRAFMKKCLIEEWGNECSYCGYKQKYKELTLDHVNPIAKQGTDDYTNLLPACRPCNISKADKPVRQWYFEHPSYTAERWAKIKQHITKENKYETLSSM